MTVAPERGSAFRLIAEQRQGQPDVVRLAQSLCLAAQAEPYFVREARLRFVPLSGIGLEARLWFSPLVEAADSRALVLYPEVSAELRQELSSHDRDFLGSVRDFTRSAHRCAPPLVRSFEELLWRGTVEPEPSEADVEQALAPLVHEIRGHGNRAAEASRWVLRFLPRLPRGVREAAAAWQLQVMAAERLGMDPPHSLVARAGEGDVRAARALVHSEVDIGVRAEAEGIVFTRPPERDALVCQASGAARVRLRLRGALPGAGWHELDLHDGERAALGAGVVAEALADGTVLTAQAELGGTVRSARAGHRGAVAVTADGRTVLRVDDGDAVLSLGLPGTPRLLAVADAGPPATAAVTGSGLHVVTTALDGAADSVLHRLRAEPAALGWSRAEQTDVLCLASGTEVVLARDGDPRRVVGVLSHSAEVVRLWCSARAGVVAVAEAGGAVTVHRLPSGDGTTVRVRAAGPEVTALGGDPASGAVVWAGADGTVHGLPGRNIREVHDDAESPAVADTARALGLLPAPATSLTVLAGAGLVVAADGGPRLTRLPWPAGGAATTVPVSFRVREVHPAPDGRLLLTGTGGELEIRSEDDRTHLITPGPLPVSPDGSGPGWLHDTVGMSLPGGDSALPTRIRRWGVGHVCLSASLEPGSGRFAALSGQAREQTLRVMADLRPPDATASAADVLERAYGLLEQRVDGLRLIGDGHWPAALVRRLRHLVDAYPQVALVAAAGSDATGASGTDSGGGADSGRGADGGGASGAGCHLTVGPPPDGPAAVTGPGRVWALPGTVPHLRACLLLALPGCHEVPHTLLASAAPGPRRLRTLLAARAGQLALRHGGVEVVPAGEPRVTAVLRHHAGQSVLCLTSSAGVPVTARVPVPPPEPQAELIEIARDDPDPPARAAPEVIRPAGGVFSVALGPGGTRWFRLRPVRHPHPHTTPVAANPAGSPAR